MGSELIQNLQERIILADVSNNDLNITNDQNASIEPEEGYAGYVKDGVEVVDVKVVPKQKDGVDKFGIPIHGPRKTWDKI